MTAFAQVGTKPTTFPVETNPQQSNFEFYSQKNDVNSKSDFNSVRKNMMPKNIATPIAYTPTASGNPAGDYGKIVTTTSGNTYFIDGYGNGKLLTSSTQTGTSETQFDKVGTIVYSMYPIPSDTKKYRVERNGILLTLSNDFTLTGSNTLNFVEPLIGETVKIIISSSFIN